MKNLTLALLLATGFAFGNTAEAPKTDASKSADTAVVGEKKADDKAAPAADVAKKDEKAPAAK